METGRAEEKYLSRHSLTPLLLTASLLSLPGSAQPPSLQHDEQPLVWTFWFLTITGSCCSALSLPRISKSFLTFLLLSLACESSSLESFLTESLPSPPSPYHLQPGQLAGLLSFLYFLPRLVLQPAVSGLLELQAFTWERIVVTAVTGGHSHTPALQLSPLLVMAVLLVVVREWRLLSWSQLLLCCACLLSAGGGLTSPPRPVSSLSWSEWRQVCPGPQSGGLSVEEAAVCQHFTGLGVSWEGRVTSIQFRERTNTLETFLNILPDSVRVWTNVDCVLGSRSDH